MNDSEYMLVEALMRVNDDIRTIFAEDDDQNIFEFKKANSKYMREHIPQHSAAKDELVENYRSGKPSWACPTFGQLLVTKTRNSN